MLPEPVAWEEVAVWHSRDVLCGRLLLCCLLLDNVVLQSLLSFAVSLIQFYLNRQAFAVTVGGKRDRITGAILFQCFSQAVRAVQRGTIDACENLSFPQSAFSRS